MKKGYFFLSSALALAIGVTGAIAQNTVPTAKKVVVNPDGSYTVIEYPIGKEVTVNLLPTGTITGTGVARVIRSADGTKVFVDVNGVPTDVTNYYAYAVDPSGSATLLGPITFTSGVGKAEFTTPLNQFMVVLSPNAGLTAVDHTTTVVYRSELPSGYVVVPRKMRGDSKASGVAASVINKYEVPVLNVPSFGESTRELKIKFSGELTGLEGKATLSRKKGTTKVKMQFDDMNKVPKNKRFILWASSPDGQYTKLGQVVNSGRKEEAVISSETSLADFGLFVTVEDAEVMVPTSPTYSVFSITPAT